jgi:hypothetical protein
MNNSKDDLPVCTQEKPTVRPPTKKRLVEISSHVSIAEVSGVIAFQADQKILSKLSALPEDRVKTCLYNLIRSYLQNCTNKENWKFPGRNTSFSKEAWRTARYLLPFLVDWAEEPQTRKTNSYKKIVRALKAEGFTENNALRVAAFVIRVNIENYGKPEGKSWPGNDPCLNPKRFKRTLEKQKPEKVSIIRGPLEGRVKTLLRDHGLFPDNVQFHMPAIVESILDGEYFLALSSPWAEFSLMKF